MRAREFIKESKLQDVHDYLDMVRTSLPKAFVIPELKNNDFYDLYRFGVAIADVRGTSGDDNISNGFKPEFRPESVWGEKQIIVSYDPDIEQVIDSALKKVNKKGKVKITTGHSEEMADAVKNSPIKPFKGYKR
jgi:hypothetical protein